MNWCGVGRETHPCPMFLSHNTFLENIHFSSIMYFPLKLSPLSACIIVLIEIYEDIRYDHRTECIKLMATEIQGLTHKAKECCQWVPLTIFIFLSVEFSLFFSPVFVKVIVLQKGKKNWIFISGGRCMKMHRNWHDYSISSLGWRQHLKKKCKPLTPNFYHMQLFCITAGRTNSNHSPAGCVAQPRTILHAVPQRIWGTEQRRYSQEVLKQIEQSEIEQQLMAFVEQV